MIHMGLGNTSLSKLVAFAVVRSAAAAACANLLRAFPTLSRSTCPTTASRVLFTHRRQSWPVLTSPSTASSVCSLALLEIVHQFLGPEAPERCLVGPNRVPPG